MVLGFSATTQQAAEIEAAGYQLKTVSQVRSWETDELVNVLRIVAPDGSEFESTRDAWLHWKDPDLYAELNQYRRSGAAQLPEIEKEIQAFEAKINNARAHIERGDGVAHYQRVEAHWIPYLDRAKQQLDTARAFADRREELQARLNTLFGGLHDSPR